MPDAVAEDRRHDARREGDDWSTRATRLEKLIRRGHLWLLVAVAVSGVVVYVAVQIIQPTLRVTQLEAEVVALPASFHTSLDSVRTIQKADHDSTDARLTSLEENVAALLALSCANLSPRDLALARAQCRRAQTRAGFPTH